MNEATDMDLRDLQYLLESLKGRLNKMPQKSKVDVAARLRAVTKTAEEICDTIKDQLKVYLKGKAGTVPGDLFKANVAYIQATKLDQQKLKVEYPKVYNACLATTEQARVTYEVK